MDVKALPVLDTSAHHIMVRRSTIPHPDTGLSLLAPSVFGKGKVFGL